MIKLLILCIPDSEPLMLKCREMIEAREEEQVEVLGRVWPWDETSWQNMPLLVAVTWSKIVDDPDINPTIQFLVSIELCSIRGEHQNGVM